MNETDARDERIETPDEHTGTPDKHVNANRTEKRATPERDDTRIGVDVGGTFTDVALTVDDRLVTAKAVSYTHL
ncbi:oxoprolinase family protein, partial [Natronorubrum tibetense]